MKNNLGLFLAKRALLNPSLEAFVDTHRDLALANLADLDPPRTVYAITFTHPTPPERIAAATAWADG